SSVADRIEPRDATIPAVSVHLRRAAHVLCHAALQSLPSRFLRDQSWLSRVGYPGSGGDPNTSRRRAIFATIV
ncbi:hypothetical protein FOC4_g10008697, partial [Fusarium odoratissimum]